MGEVTARDVVADVFDRGFEHAEEGRPYDYADEIIRRLRQAGFGIHKEDRDGDCLKYLAGLRAFGEPRTDRGAHGKEGNRG